MEGNQMKMREALERLDALNLNVLKYPLDGDSSEIYDADKKPIPLPAWGVATLLNGAKEAQVLAREALSEPPRNCNAGTAEAQLQRWRKFCNKQNGCEDCPCNKYLGISADCFAKWAQMPYAEEGAEHGKA